MLEILSIIRDNNIEYRKLCGRINELKQQQNEQRLKLNSLFPDSMCPQNY